MIGTNISLQKTKIGILGGGQLGRMLIQSGLNLNLNFSVLDPDEHAPCKGLAELTVGSLTDYDTVLKFGQSCDLITIEIENVNTRALKQLVLNGKKVYPQPHLIELIQDKRIQKQFYLDNQIPTAEFILVNDKLDLLKHKLFLPGVQKLAKEGYDGKGVQRLIDEQDILKKAFDAPGLVEKLIDFETEIAVIVARSESGKTTSYPPVEMVFHKEKNLVEYLFSPASIAPSIQRTATQIAENIIHALGLVGLLAVEMFVTKEGAVLVNEIAPRPHNSGHQTIEANITSQYEQHLRAILDLPLGDVRVNYPSIMINILGEESSNGTAKYQGLHEVLEVSGAYVHLYGKVTTKPFRKMGHVTIIDNDLETLRKKARFVKDTLKVIA